MRPALCKGPLLINIIDSSIVILCHYKFMYYEPIFPFLFHTHSTDPFPLLLLQITATYSDAKWQPLFFTFFSHPLFLKFARHTTPAVHGLRWKKIATRLPVMRWVMSSECMRSCLEGGMAGSNSDKSRWQTSRHRRPLVLRRNFFRCSSRNCAPCNEPTRWRPATRLLLVFKSKFIVGCICLFWENAGSTQFVSNVVEILMAKASCCWIGKIGFEFARLLEWRLVAALSPTSQHPELARGDIALRWLPLRWYSAAVM